MEKLTDFTIGQKGVIYKVEGEKKIRRRLFDMGVTPGAEVFLRKVAPLGDPIEITIRNYELSLRKSEASCIYVEIGEWHD
jgi:Fe2+ transport system protein FeoA